MTLFSLSMAYIRSRWLTNGLLVLLLALGVTTISLLLHFNHQAEDRLSRDARGFDLVVGAKGSPLQLILSSIYHMDIPTGNIPLAEAERLKNHPQVKQAIPLALGDSYKGFRIVGTDVDYIKHYEAELSEGTMFGSPMEAVIGAHVAADAKLALNQTFAGSHGLSEGGDEHAEMPYKVVGIMKPTGSVIDRLVLTPVASVWQVHGSEANHHHEHEDESEHNAHEHEAEAVRDYEHEHVHNAHEEKSAGRAEANEASNEITALLIRFRSPAAAMSLPREINRTTSMQAASPPYETARLLSLLGMGLDTLRIFGFILIISAIAGMLIALYQSMQERRTDLALMRVLGASRLTLVKQLWLESGLLLAAGIMAGLLLAHMSLVLLPALVPQLKHLSFVAWQFLATEIIIVGGIFIAGLIVSLLTALAAYRVDVSRTLARA